MRRILEILLIIGGMLLAFRIGWLAPLFALAIFLFACGLRVFSFTKAPTFNASLVLSIATFLLVVLLILLGTAAASVYLREHRWLATGAMLLLMFVAGLFLVAYFVGRMTYGLYPQYQGRPLGATASAMRDMLGINKGVWTVSNGAGQVTGPQAESLQTVGGPGTLIVQDGHAVITERQGTNRRVLRAGSHPLAAFERVSMIVPLGPQQEKLKIQNLATNDQIQIEEFNLLVFHRLASDTDLFLLNTIWNPAASTWNGAIRSISENTTRDVVGRYKFDQICPLSDANRTAFRATLLDEIKKTASKVGAEVTQVDFGEVCVPAEAMSTLLQRRVAQWRVEIAESEGERQGIFEGRRALAQGAMMDEIGSRLTSATPDQQLAALEMMRLIEALEKVAENPGMNLVLSAELLRLLEQVNFSGARSGPASGAPTAAPPTIP